MLILHGTYFWFHRVVGYRNDYCLTCGVERMAFQHRTFDVHHIFWIPILPLGIWKRWRCSVCGNDPHASPRTRRSLKWAGIVCLALFSLSGWAVSTSEQPDDAAFIWGMRLGGPIALVWAVWATIKSPRDIDLREKLRTVRPVVELTCPLCKVNMLPTEPAWQCPQCGIKRRPLPAA